VQTFTGSSALAAVRKASYAAFFLCLLSLAVPASADWREIWSDEFNGAALDTSKWQHNLGDGCSAGFTRPGFNNSPRCNFGTLEREYNLAENVTVVTEGTTKFLRISAKINTNNALRCAIPDVPEREPGTPNQGVCPYTSGRIDNLNGIGDNLQYGKIEARMRAPSANGAWPAFWMLGTSTKLNLEWPRTGEIDIMEHVNSSRWVYGTLHWHDLNWTNGYRNIWWGDQINDFMQWPRASGDASSIGLGSAEWGYSPRTRAGGTPNLALPTMDAVNWFTNWHTYGVEWSPTSIKWYLDGFVLQETPNTVIGNSGISTEEFHKPFYVILNLAVGGDWPENVGLTGNDNLAKGNPAHATYPYHFDIDYVRVYQYEPPAAGSNSWYQVKNVQTGKCVNNESLFTHPPTPGNPVSNLVNEVTCASSSAQHWSFVPVSGRPGYYKIVNRHGSAGRVLQVQDKVPVNFGGQTGFGRGLMAEIWQYGLSSTQTSGNGWASDTNTSNQEWSLGYNGVNYAIVNREIRSCLTGANSNGSPMTWAACDGTNRQLYRLISVP
jgi:beta-glucanase (GH16 family)